MNTCHELLLPNILVPRGEIFIQAFEMVDKAEGIPLFL